MAEDSYVRSTNPVLKATEVKSKKEKERGEKKKNEETQLDIVGIW